MSAERRLVLPLRQVELLVVVDPVELGGIVELEGRERFQSELLFVEPTRLSEVVDHQRHVVDSDQSRHGRHSNPIVDRCGAITSAPCTLR